MVSTSEVNRVIDILSWAQEKNIKDISERMPPNETDLKEKDRDKAAS